MKKIFTYLSPAIAAVIATFIVYRVVICCLRRRAAEPGSHRRTPPPYEPPQPERSQLLPTPHPTRRLEETRTVQRGDVVHELHIYSRDPEREADVRETAF